MQKMPLVVHYHGGNVVATLLAVLWLAACATTPDDIDKWADSVGGEERIAKAMADAKTEASVRVYALVKLIKLGELDRMIGALKELPEAERLATIKEGGPEIGKLFKVPDLKVQAAAKDALYAFTKLGHQTLEEQSRQALLAWYSYNFMDKYAAGNFSAFHVLSDIGPAAGDVLVALLEKEPPAWAKVGKIIEKINDPGTTRKASDLILKWLVEQSPGFAPELLQLATGVRDDRVTDFLDAFVAEKKNTMASREAAFNTLSFNVSKRSLPVALAIFTDRKESIDLRGIAIEIIRKVGEPANLQYVYPFLKDEAVKWAAFGTVLKIGGAAELEKALGELNPTVVFWRDDYDIAQRHFMKFLSKDAAPTFVKFLKSPHIPLVTMALLGLQVHADAALADAEVKPLFDNARQIKNYLDEKPYTIGELARAVHKAILERPAGAVQKPDGDADAAKDEAQEPAE
ncbi:MAG: hypothetical protein C4523_01425 [Myxococcales bacterium]|nr:MAG: hypothetical protein C4523_01425 [Myxococcales bacterium]